MKTAIVCYSFTHNNFVLAGEILSRTGGTLFVIEETNKRTKFSIFMDLLFHRIPPIKEYLHISDRFDHYILISPIWGGKIATPLKAFLLKEREKISSYSFISVCGGGEKQQHQVEAELTALTKKEPVKVLQLALAGLAGDQHANLMNYSVEPGDLQFYHDAIEEFIQATTSALTVHS